MTFKDHFSTQAYDYARYRPDYPQDLFAWLANESPARALAWDSATGSGQAALSLAEHFSAVTATDASEAQIRHAHAHPRVAYAVSPSEGTAIATGAVDLVFVAQALHWFDLPAFYREVHRVTRQGALVAVCSYALMAVEPAIDAVVEHFYSHTLEGHWPPERVHVERGYSDLPFPFARIDHPNFEMCRQWDLATLLGYLGTWSAVARYRNANGADPLQALANELAACWGDPDTAKAVRWPLKLMIGRVSQRHNAAEA